MTTSNFPPDWAIEQALVEPNRASEKNEVSIWTLEEIKRGGWHLGYCASILAHARLIAKHEQPPVNPDLLIAREACALNSKDNMSPLCYRRGEMDDHAVVKACLDAIRLVREGWKPENRKASENSTSVPEGQTALSKNLGHRLLDVFNEGIKARDNDTHSPYHGHSLEHCLHAAGWVQRDLRLALDDAKAKLIREGLKP